MPSISTAGWLVHGSIMLPEIKKIIDEDKTVVPVEYWNQKLLPDAYLDKPMGSNDGWSGS